MPSGTSPIRRAADLVAVPWRNGQGVTRDVATQLDSDGTLLWQVSIAELERDCPFSDFSGYDRIFTPVAGGGIALAIGGGGFVPCPLLVPVTFPGEAAVSCRVGLTPGRAFNVIAARGRCQAQVRVVRLAPGMAVVAPASGHMLLHCWSGTLDCAGATVEPGDTAIGLGCIAREPAVALQVSLR